MKKVISLVFVAFCFMQTALAENGTIRGKIVDGENGEELIGVNVIIQGTTIGTASDIDGSFVFQVEAGVYSIVFSYISYLTKVVEEVEVGEGKVTSLDIISLDPEGLGLDEVVITARALKNTDASLVNIQMKSLNVIDGISEQTFSRTGDGDAAAAIRRVTGVTVEDGKYVYVRGLGDRYSKSILNGLEIPGLDPERNSVQMDIFPTNIIDNIIVYKSFTPNLPGDFTGGLVDITTKDFPSTLSMELSASFGYNSLTHFRDGFLTYNGANKIDALGLGSKQRALPFDVRYEPDRRNLDLLFKNTNALNKEVEAKEGTTSFLDQSYSFSIGNQINGKRATAGFLAAINYRNSYDFQPDNYIAFIRLFPTDSVDNQVGRDTQRTLYFVDQQEIQRGRVGIQNALWSAMSSGSIKWKMSKMGVKFLHTQASQKSATQRIEEDLFDDNFSSYTNSLDYLQRSVSNILLNGEHFAARDKWKISWANALTKNKLSNPDQTNSSFVMRGDRLLFNPGSAYLRKVTRTLDEWNNNFRADFRLNFNQWKGEEAKFLAGVNHSYKKREFSTETVAIGSSNSFNEDLIDVSEGLDDILSTDRLLSPTNDLGYLIDGVLIDKENQYLATLQIIASYIMTELPLHDRVKFVGGLRTEWAIMNYTGNEFLSGNPIDGTVLNSFQFLPSANFIFELADNFNLRTNYSRTLARPSFREKSESFIFDPVSNNTFYGNLDLVETHIHNTDLRLEYFFGGSDLISLSGFYKHFTNPIEIQPLENAGIRDIQPVNRPESNVYGIELEVRKNLDFLSEALSDLSFSANFTYVKSVIEQSEEQKEKYILLNQPIKETRTMLGLSPIVFNAGLSYANTSMGTEINLSYNVKGKTLVLAGIGTIPDVYEDPYHGLDFKMSQKMGKNDQFKLSASVQNILGDNFYQYYEYLDQELETFRSYSRGREVSLGFSYSLN